ncbi:hypothetical protein M378DRAFT_200441 [Amanita muscaria Koide BX008]|uniref:Uncharacterized protein n=1 Tax=Amanita muscaria (strain Koide BX008) TaxID=946122 RepID=A0A0C2WPI1_AMAMK|nr:hypothetical protein M378DRAFT_200441 [Amanita muscaria Koide BX008]
MVLDLLGTRAFLPTLCAQLQKASTQPIPLDPVILQSILLVLAIGHRKNLILRAVDPEEVPIIARIAEWILSTVFNLSTHRLKIRPSKPSKSKVPDDGLANPTAFLRSLFLVPTVEASHSNRMLSTTQGTAPHDKAQTDPFADSRRASESSIAQSHAQYLTNPGHIVSPFSSNPHSHHQSNKRYSRSSSHFMPKPKSRPSSSAASVALHIPSALIITGLEDASDASQRALVRVLANGRLELPKHGAQIGAHNHYPEGPETESWDLPEEFTMIYIAYWEPKKRPAIHKSLLDKFAMSTNVSVSPKVKRALRSLSTASSIGMKAQNPFASRPNSPYPHSQSVHSTPRSVSGSLPHHLARPHSQTPQQRPIPLSASNTLTSSATANILTASPQPVPSTNQEITSSTLPADFLLHLRNAMHRTQLSPSINLYLQDLFSAARFDSPELDGTLLTAKAMEDAEMLIRACRVLGTELGGWELVRGGASDSMARTDGLKTEEDQGDSSSMNGHTWEFETGYDPSGSIAIDIGIEGTNSERRSVGIQEHVRDSSADKGTPRVSVDKSDDVAEVANSAEDLFDVSEAYVARIVPRVISHRVKMRESWRDEVLAGVVCGATFSVEQDSQDDLGRGQRTTQAEGDLTVKDMLVRILQRV